jgi:hypothetical protein
MGTPMAEWWKDYEQLAHLFERAFRPLQEVLHDIWMDDAAGEPRQLDVAIFVAGEEGLHGFAEVQKRKSKVGLKDFGDWIYKMQTLGASELVALSEAGFARTVRKHVEELHAGRVRLARIYEIPDGAIEELGTRFIGIHGLENLWRFPGVFYQTVDDEISAIAGNPVDVHAKSFTHVASGARLSLMDVVLSAGIRPTALAGDYYNATIDLGGELLWGDKRLKRLMACIEIKPRIQKTPNRFFAYAEEFPIPGRRGICCVAELMIDGKPATMRVVAVPTESDVLVSGQLSLTSHDPS